MLGTVPIGEIFIEGNGDSEKGPAMRLAVNFLIILPATISFFSKADLRLGQNCEPLFLQIQDKTHVKTH